MASVRHPCDTAASATGCADRHELREEPQVREQGEGAKPMSIAEVLETDEARGLMESGRESGSLSTEEIALALSELELDASQVDEVYHALEELQIEVVDGTEEPEREVEQAQPREVSTDSLQLFLKDIGKVDRKSTRLNSSHSQISYAV